jgi:hypothetical protein
VKLSRLAPHEWLALLLLHFSLSIIVCFVSNNVQTRLEHRQETVLQQFAILEGHSYLVDGEETDPPQFRSRVLFPAMLALASRWEIVPPAAWFVILRIATAWLAFLVFWLLLVEAAGASLKLAAAGCGWLALGLILTFNHSWEHPTDFLDVLFFSLALWFAVQRKATLLAAATILGSLNHQTIAFAGVLWACLYGMDASRKVRPAEIGFAGLLMALSRATSWLVETAIRGSAGWGHVMNGRETIGQFLHFLAHPYASGWPVLLFALVAPTAVWLVVNRQSLDAAGWRILLAVGITIGVSSVIAFMAELRSVFLAPHVMATFVAVGAEARAQLGPRQPVPGNSIAGSGGRPGRSSGGASGMPGGTGG